MTVRARRVLRDAPVARLRTRRHPAAEAFPDVASYDDLYERADSFDELYDAIVEDLADLARRSGDGEVVYAVPGSALVAERTVELLRERDDLTVVVEPAVSVIDVACAARGVDPMAVQLRVIDALAPGERVRGPGPLLVLQTYAPAVLAAFADRLDAETPVTVLHHLGLDDEVVTTLAARRLATFAADHLTSLWIDEVRGPGESLDELVSITHRLRRECPWDREQTHESLMPYLVEETYEAVETIEAADLAGLREELGDVLLQVMFHARIASERTDGSGFDIDDVASGIAAKLIRRHPHVFGAASVSGAEEVSQNWETIKAAERAAAAAERAARMGADGPTQVASALDGVPLGQPALPLAAQLLGRATRAGAPAAPAALADLADLADLGPDGTGEVSDLGAGLFALVVRARETGQDPELELRRAARRYRDRVRAWERGREVPSP